MILTQTGVWHSLAQKPTVTACFLGTKILYNQTPTPGSNFVSRNYSPQTCASATPTSCCPQESHSFIPTDMYRWNDHFLPFSSNASQSCTPFKSRRLYFRTNLHLWVVIHLRQPHLLGAKCLEGRSSLPKFCSFLLKKILNQQCLPVCSPVISLNS